MSAWTRWQGWSSVVLGGSLRLFLAPWRFGYSGLHAVTADARMIGALTVIDAIWRGSSGSPVPRPPRRLRRRG
jgi:hypothetical protein